MNGNDDFDFTHEQLRADLPPWQEPELKRDLWPRMLRRMEENPVRFGWAEWTAAGLIGLALAAFPEVIPMMLYNL